VPVPTASAPGRSSARCLVERAARRPSRANKRISCIWDGHHCRGARGQGKCIRSWWRAPRRGSNRGGPAGRWVIAWCRSGEKFGMSSRAGRGPRSQGDPRRHASDPVIAGRRPWTGSASSLRCGSARHTPMCGHRECRGQRPLHLWRACRRGMHRSGSLAGWCRCLPIQFPQGPLVIRELTEILEKPAHRTCLAPRLAGAPTAVRGEPTGRRETDLRPSQSCVHSAG